MYALFNFIGEIQMTKVQAQTGSHRGDCEDDVNYLMTVPTIKRQLKKIDPEQLKLELKEYGAWDEEELSNHDSNIQRITWLACCDIVERLH